MKERTYFENTLYIQILITASTYTHDINNFLKINNNFLSLVK